MVADKIYQRCAWKKVCVGLIKGAHSSMIEVQYLAPNKPLTTMILLQIWEQLADTLSHLSIPAHLTALLNYSLHLISSVVLDFVFWSYFICHFRKLRKLFFSQVNPCLLSSPMHLFLPYHLSTFLIKWVFMSITSFFFYINAVIQLFS